MTLTRTEQLELARCAQACYARGKTAHGHLLSGVAASVTVSTERYDLAMGIYRDWLVDGSLRAIPTTHAPPRPERSGR